MRGAGGSQEAVTTGNRSEYIRQLCHHLLTSAIEQQTAAVSRGLLSIIPEPVLMVTVGCCDDDAARSCAPVQAMRQCLNAQELDVLLAGELSVDIDNWQQHTLYESFSRESPQVVWFWELVREWEPSQLSGLLIFVTGPASHRVHAAVTHCWVCCPGSGSVGVDGFEHLQGYHGQEHKFTIRRDDQGTQKLPTAQTCFNRLKLPAYPSKEELRDRLLLAVEGGSALFDEAAVAV